VVFALHFHAFAFLMLIITAALQPISQRMVQTQTLGPIGVAAAVLSSVAEVVVVVYQYLALRGSYGGSRTVTLVKAVVLMVGHVAFLLTVSLLTVPSLREAVWRELSGS
jgi:hypothetical protein